MYIVCRKISSMIVDSYVPEFPRLVIIRRAVDSMQRLSCVFMAKIGRLVDTSPPSPLRWLSSSSLKLA